MKTSSEIKNSSKVTKKDLRRVFWRTFTMGASWEYTRQMGVGYGYAITPVIDRIYKDKKEKAEALKRHLEFFNITNVLAPIVLGITAAMEEENAKNKNFDTNSINNIKVSLMGPLSAIGDSLFMATLRIIATGIAAAFSLQGNVLGPILFLLIYNVPCTLVRYFGLKFGYRAGTSFFEKLGDSNLIAKVSKQASVLGMMVVGAMTGSLITINTPVVFGSGKAAIKLQADVFDKILPGMLPLAVTFLMYYLLSKKVKIGYILLGTAIVGILGTAAGVLVP
ncbi:PTS system mannose/fructose/sorbose family transporter subunit IID [Clostridium neuense]|uniref:PTS system mannose/fructose/sorbose family transporter subunit IID n=1 Tax=Clostridium neuense TaxID=1728934 RepID=A0ABW8TLK1_9CLOT